jgi:hypothetical protein
MKKVIFIMLAFLLLVNVARAGNWIIQTVDNEGDVGAGTVMWLDSLGFPHIIYCPGLHTWWTASGWLKEGGVGSTGGLDLVVDSLGRPHVSYLSAISAHYTYRDESGWHDTQLYPKVDRNSSSISIALDSRENPHIVMVAYDGIMHWYIDSLGLWKNELIPVAGDVGPWLSMAIDDTNKIYIAYNTSSSPGHLKLAYFDGNAWGTQYVDLDDNVGEYCDLILDENGVPHIAYYDRANTRLKYATWSARR